MAVQFTDFSRAPLLDSPYKDLLGNVLKGYKMAKEPEKMAEESQQRKLANSLKGLELEHKPKEYDLDDKQKELANALSAKANEHYEEKFNMERDLNQANINKANRPAAFKDALTGLFKARDSLNPNDPNYEKDLNSINGRIDKLSKPSNGVQLSTNPQGGIELSIGGDKATTLGLPGLKKDETYLLDDKGKPIGIGKPYLVGEKKEFAGRAAFNIWQKFIAKAQAPYSGKGATRQWESDVRNYTRDPEAKQRVDDAITADKLLFSTTVKEVATLSGANTNKSYDRITKSLQDSEIYPFLKNISKYQLPQGYKQASSDKFRELINEGTKAGDNIPPYKPYYFNSEKGNTSNTSNAGNSASQQPAPSSKEPQIPEILVPDKEGNGMTVVKGGFPKGSKTYDPNLRRKIPTKLVDSYIEENSEPAFGGAYG